MIRIVLDDEQFGALVRGKVVEVRTAMVGKPAPIPGGDRDVAVTITDVPVQIVLSDIGFERMDELLWEAVQAAE